MRRIFAPSFTPLGIFTDTLRGRTTAPLPLHAPHGASIICPRPRHWGHGRETLNMPCAVCTIPVPSHVGHGRVAVPGRAPDPPQVPHGSGCWTRTVTVPPWTAVSKVSAPSAAG